MADQIKFLNQITPSSNNLGAGDKLVGVSGATDLLFTPAQVAAGLPGGGGGGVPGGSTTQVQFNNSGVFGGDVGFTYGGNGKATLGSVGGGTGGALSFKGSSSGTVSLASAPAAGAWTLQLPTTPGSPGFVLRTDGSGNTSWIAVGAGNLTLATGDVTYHVTATGNDTTGDGSVGAPFATIQHAYGIGAATFNFNGFNFTIQVGPGTFQGLDVYLDLISCANIVLIGDNSVAVGTPSPVILTTNPRISGACTITTGKTSSSSAPVWVSGFTFTGNNNGAIDAGTFVFLGEPTGTQPSKNYYKPSIAAGGAVQTVLVNAVIDFCNAVSTFDVSVINSYSAFICTIEGETVFNTRIFLDNWRIVGGTVTFNKGFIWHESVNTFEVDITSGLAAGAGLVVGPSCRVETNSILLVQDITKLPGTQLPVLVTGGTLGDFVNNQTTTGSNPAAGSAYVFTGPSVNIGRQTDTTGQLKLIGKTSGQVTLSTQDAAGTWTLKFPTTTGTVNQVLQTDGTGVTSWVTPAGGGGGTPGAPAGSVQFNSAGTFTGSADFMWLTGAGNGLTIGGATLAGSVITAGAGEHQAIGTHAVIDTDVFAPGDPVNMTVQPGKPLALNLVEYYTGDLSVGHSRNNIATGLGLRHTGTSKAFAYNYSSGAVIASNSTGPWSALGDMHLNPINYGSGLVDFMSALYLELDNNGSAAVTLAYGIEIQLAGTGPITTGAGIHIERPTVNVATGYGILLEDHSTSNNSVNIYSKGVGSSNKIEGRLALGPAATNASPTNGDFWYDGTHLGFRKGSTTINLDAPGIPINNESVAYTAVLADANTAITHPATDNTARTFTIPANASVAYPTGTTLTFVNMINTLTIAITTDTMTLAGAGTTGSRTLAANGIATALKLTSTTWLISGTGLT